MASSISNPAGRLSRRGSLWMGLLVALCLAAFLVSRLMPNLMATLFPGGDNLGGQWVGMVQYKPDQTGQSKQPAALRLTLKPTRLANVVPMYTLQGEVRVAGRADPITFSANELIGGREQGSLDGQLSSAADPGLAGATVAGRLRDGRLADFEMDGISRHVAASVKGTLQRGSDTDYRRLLNQLH